MQEYGYQILQALVTDMDPDQRVKGAMNEINASKRLREAATNKAEADKIMQVGSFFSFRFVSFRFSFLFSVRFCFVSVRSCFRFVMLRFVEPVVTFWQKGRTGGWCEGL